jgi:hypothetical protein
LPLVEDPLVVAAPEADAPVEAPVDALADEVDELDDEHAAVTPSSNAAAAPAAGTDKDRFIPAPSCEWQHRGNIWVDGAAAMSPVSRNPSPVIFIGGFTVPGSTYRF